MLSKIRSCTLTRFFCGVLGLYFLNLSVDNAYPSPEQIPEFISFNDQESIIEILVEQVIGFEDYFIELEHPESETKSPKHNTKTELKLNLPIWLGLLPEYIDSFNTLPTTKEAFLRQSYPQIDPPPPKC